MRTVNEFLAGQQRLMFLDVESIGLHGEGFAFGYQVVVCHNSELNAVAELAAHCPPINASGHIVDYDWVEQNVPKTLENSHKLTSPKQVRDLFWKFWTNEQQLGTVIVADVPWPVEARFLAGCIDDDPAKRQGPYPILDVATILWAADMDPLASYPRKDNERNRHDPLHDARQSARLFMEAVCKIKRIPEPVNIQSHYLPVYRDEAAVE